MIRHIIDSSIKFFGRTGTSGVPYWMMAAFSLALIAIASGGAWFYFAQERELRRKSENELMAIARLKVEQIEQWRSERLVDAGFVTESALLSEVVARWLMAFASSDARFIIDKFKNFEKIYPYDDILLVDASGAIRLSIRLTRKKLHDEALVRLADVFREGKPLLTDLHLSQEDGSPYLDVIAPTFAPGSDRPVAAVILSIDANRHLYPMIQTWPLPGGSGETLLVRKEGDRVLYLNELRHRDNTALNLLIPLNRSDLPSVMAVKGKEGIVEGRDYRGVPVLAALLQVPGSSWHLVAKVDKTEVFEEWRFRGGMILTFVFLLLALTFAGFAFVWQRQRSNHHLAMLKAENDRHALRTHFDYLVKYANDIIILADEEFHIIEVNDRALQTYGYAPEEVAGFPLADLIAPEDTASFQERLRRINEEGALISEGLHRRKDGTVFPVESSARFIEVEGRRWFQAIIRDITERKRAEEEVRASEKRFRSLFENMLNGFAYCKMLYEGEVPADFIYLDVNASFESLTGLKDVIGKKVSEVIPGIRESDPELFKIYGRVALTGIPETFETFVDALKMWFSISVYSPEKEYFVAVFDVITERKRAEEELRVSYRFLQIAYMHADMISLLEAFVKETKNYSGCNAVGIRILDSEGNIPYQAYDGFNKGFFEMESPLSIKSDKCMCINVIKGDIDPVLPFYTEGGSFYMNGTTRFLSTVSEDEKGETRNVCNQVGYESVGLVPIRMKGRILGLIHVADTREGMVPLEKVELLEKEGMQLGTAILNILAEEKVRALNAVLEQRVTDRTAQLEAANKELEAFSYSVSHDLRAPLRSIDGFSQAVLEDYTERLDDKGRDYLNRIRTASQRMALLIDDILKLSRVSRSEIRFAPTDLSGLVRTVAGELSEREPGRDARFIIAESVTVSGDPALLSIAMENLLGNAWKFTSKRSGAVIEFGIIEREGERTLFVRDNGAGFDMQYAERLFGAFQRLHTADEFEGTGIGLTLVQRIINRHGGRIWAEGGVDKGATIFFTLPYIN